MVPVIKKGTTKCMKQTRRNPGNSLKSAGLVLLTKVVVMPNDDVTATPKTLVKKSDRARLSMELISTSLARSDCVMTMTEVCCRLLYSLILTLTASWRKKLNIFRESDLVKNAIFLIKTVFVIPTPTYMVAVMWSPMLPKPTGGLNHTYNISPVKGNINFISGIAFLTFWVSRV